nr:alpha/beta hydrolase [Dysosmobacter acutus]
MLHGLGQTPQSWDRTISHLPDSDVRCPDLFRPLGGKEHTYQALYQGLCRSCGEVEPPFVLCGLSLGAVAALHYAMDHPGRVSALILIAPQYRMPKTLMRLQNALFRLMPERSFREMGLGKKAALELTGSMADLDLSRGLSSVACPVKLLCGKRDRANRKAAEELSRLLPEARLEWMEGAGHQVNLDAPEALARSIGDFLEK